MTNGTRRTVSIAALSALLLPAAASAQVTPGQWDIVTTIATIDMPGMPAGIVNMMKGKPIRVKHCLTAEEAARGPQDMMKTDKSCRFANYSMAGGKLASTMICARGGQTITSTTSGSFTPTSFTATGKSVITGGQAMTMTATTVGTRTGTCK